MILKKIVYSKFFLIQFTQIDIQSNLDNSNFKKRIKIFE